MWLLHTLDDFDLCDFVSAALTCIGVALLIYAGLLA